MNQENIERINELRNNKILLNNINEIMELIDTNKYEEITETLISDFVDAVQNVNDDLKSKLDTQATKFVETFMGNHNIDNEKLNEIYNELEEMVNIINKASKSYEPSPGDKIRAKIEQINFRRKLREEFREVEDQYLEDAIFLSNHLGRDGERVYTDEWLFEKLDSLEGRYEIVEIANAIRNLGMNTPTKNTIIEPEPIPKEPIPEEPIPEEPTPEEPTLEESTPGEPTPEEPTLGEPTSTIENLKQYEFELNEEATLQNYNNQGFNKNSYGYFDPWTDEYSETYDPTKDTSFQMFNVYETIQVLDEEATLKKYREDGFSRNYGNTGEYFNPWINEYDENYNPLNDPEYQVYKKGPRVFKGVYTHEELEKLLGYKPDKLTTPTDEIKEPIPEPIPEPSPEETYSIEETLRKLIDNLDPELPKNELDDLLNKIYQIFMIIVEKDTKEFLEDLKNATNFRDKVNVVTKFENKIEKYSDLLKHENPSIQSILDEQNLVGNIKEKYKEAKSISPEYCWREYENVKTAIEYVDSKVNMMLFNQYLEDLSIVLREPTEENHKVWQKNMIDFVTIEGYDPSMISTYLTAHIKDYNKDLSVDKEFNIVGLDLQKEKTPDPIEPDPNKKRKVTGVKKVLNWMREHKLATLGIGLGIAGVTLLAIPQTHMMINSGLWHALKALGAGTGTLNKLNATNLALSKVAAGGKFAFDGATGLYTLAGAAGAKAMYTAGSAKLLAALEGVLLGGGIVGVGKAVTSAVKTVANKIKSKLAEKLNKKDKDAEKNNVDEYNEEFKKTFDEFETAGDLEPNELENAEEKIINEDYSEWEPTDYEEEIENLHAIRM